MVAHEQRHAVAGHQPCVQQASAHAGTARRPLTMRRDWPGAVVNRGPLRVHAGHSMEQVGLIHAGIFRWMGEGIPDR
jgi:hypothetical protein